MKLMAWKWKGEPGHGYSYLYKTIVPLFVRRQGGGWGTWLLAYVGRAALRGLYYRTSHRLRNRYLVARAKSAGACAHSPKTAALKLGMQGGGYGHWRCGEAKHEGFGLHRYHNYVWNAEGQTQFSPVSCGRNKYGKWLDRLAPTLSLRDQRRQNRLHGRKK